MSRNSLSKKSLKIKRNHQKLFRGNEKTAENYETTHEIENVWKIDADVIADADTEVDHLPVEIFRNIPVFSLTFFLPRTMPLLRPPIMKSLSPMLMPCMLIKEF